MTLAFLAASASTASTESNAHPTGATRIAEPFPQLLYGAGLGDQSHWMNDPPDPASGCRRPNSRYAASYGIPVRIACAVAQVSTVSSVKRLCGCRIRMRVDFLGWCSYTDPMMSPAITPSMRSSTTYGRCFETSEVSARVYEEQMVTTY